jgi:hypothetical protein
MLTQLKHQFDVVDDLPDSARYDLLILPDGIPVNKVLAGKLRAYVRDGGALLVSGTSSLKRAGARELSVSRMAATRRRKNGERFARCTACASRHRCSTSNSARGMHSMSA